MFKTEGVVVCKCKVGLCRLIPYYKVQYDNPSYEYQSVENPSVHHTRAELAELHSWISPLINENSLIHNPPTPPELKPGMRVNLRKANGRDWFVVILISKDALGWTVADETLRPYHITNQRLERKFVSVDETSKVNP